MKGTGAKRNSLPRFMREYRGEVPVAPVESAPMISILTHYIQLLK